MFLFYFQQSADEGINLIPKFFPSEIPQVPPAAGAGLDQSLTGQHSLQPGSPRVGWSQIQSPHLHRCLFPQPQTRVPTGAAPGSQPSLHSAPTNTKHRSPAVTSLGLLGTLKGMWPRDGWGQAAGGRAGSDGSVTGVPPSVPQSSCHGSRETAPKNPWRKEITLGASLTCCLSSLGAMLSLQPRGLHTGTLRCGLEGGSMGWMTRGHPGGHCALAHLHVVALGAGKQPAHTQHTLHPWARLLLHRHILIPWPAGGRDNSLPAKPKMSSGFGMTPQPTSAPDILHPQTVLQSLPRALSWEGWAELGRLCRVISALPAGLHPPRHPLQDPPVPQCWPRHGMEDM